MLGNGVATTVVAQGFAFSLLRARDLIATQHTAQARRSFHHIARSAAHSVLTHF